MSRIVEQWARRQKVGSWRAKAVLMVLALQAADSGICGESIEVLAWAAEQSPASVQKQIAVLQSLGLVTVDGPTFVLAVASERKASPVARNVVPFPIARRLDLVVAVAAGMLKRAPDQAERHLELSAHRQAIVLRRRGIEQPLIDEQIAAFVSAVRAEVWRRVLTPQEAR